MPTPIGHSLAGLTIEFAGEGSRGRRDWLRFFTIITLANAPDFDFIPGYFVGNPRAFHWGAMHSIAAAVLIGGAAGWILGVRSGRYAKTMGLCICAYLSHILLDVSLGPPEPFVGLQVFWPFTTQSYMLPWSVFKMAPRSIEAGPFAALMSPEIIPVIVREILVMTPITILTWGLGRIRSRRSIPAPELAAD